jgi:putative ABC transport system permease protein
MALFPKIPRINQFLLETLRIIYFYRGRIAFSFSGIALGILTISVIIMTIEGANQRANEIFEALGPNAIMIFTGSERQRSARERLTTITVDDAESLARIEGVYDMVKVQTARGIVFRYRDRQWTTTIRGATPNYFSSMSWNFDVGSPFTARDEAERSAVCVLGAQVAEELFRGEPAVGKTVLIGRLLPAKVLGVLESRGGGFGGPNWDDMVVMPLSTVMGRVQNERKYISFVRLRTTRSVDATIEDVRTVLRANHGIVDGQDDFTIRSSRDVLEFLSVISGSLLLFLGTASIIALVVSGFVLANLFYLSIGERKKDIGIRRAFGATRRVILLSFLLEAVLITFFGGIAGVLLSVALGGVFERLFEIPMIFSYRVAVFALLFSFLTGVLSGLKPAMKASRIEPIEAMRG